MSYRDLSAETLSAGKSTMTGLEAMNTAMPIMAVFGAIQSGVGTYFAAQSQKTNLEYQQIMSNYSAEMSKLNQHMAENTAQGILEAGNRAQSQVALKAGKVIGSQKASQGARGVVIGEGNAAEEVATTNLMKEIDMHTINANAVREAWAAMMQGVGFGVQAVNASNGALMAGVSADNINPFAAAGTSLLSSGTQVASSWYQMQRSNRLENILGSMTGGKS